MWLTNFLKGIFIGIALVIPGLSGSVFAVVVGLYDKIILAINKITKDFKNQFLFLLPILIGIGLGILLSTKIVLEFSENYPVFAYSFFIGLVLASLPFVIGKINKRDVGITHILILLFGFSFIYIMGTMGSNDDSYIAIPRLTNTSQFFTIFLAGVFSSSLMSIPGVSGSVLLMVIKQYGTIYNAVSKVSDVFKSVLIGNIDEVFSNMQTVAIIIPFLLATLVGTYLVAKFLKILIEQYSSSLYVFVTGVIMASIVILIKSGIIPNAKELSSPINILISAFCLFFGFLLSKLFE